MQHSPRAGVWARIFIAFVLGFLAGFVTEYIIRPTGTLGATAGIGAATAIAASVGATVLPEFFARDREHRQFLRDHAELIRSQVYVPLVSSRTTLLGQTLYLAEVNMDLQRSGAPDWGYPAEEVSRPVGELANWRLGKAHIETDSGLAAGFERTWARLNQRVGRKSDMDSLFLTRVVDHVEAVFGPGYPVASTLTIPEPPRWVNAAAFVGWIRGGTVRSDFTEQVAGSQHRIIGGGMVLLTSDRPFTAPASDFSKVIAACLNDPQLRSSWSDWLVADREDQTTLSDFLSAIKLEGERIQATHHIEGRCEVCAP